jgi:hypothetical protein
MTNVVQYLFATGTHDFTKRKSLAMRHSFVVLSLPATSTLAALLPPPPRQPRPQYRPVNSTVQARLRDQGYVS